MFWLFKAESFSWALLQNSCNSRSGWCTLHNVFPGEKCWTARLKSTLPRGRFHAAAQFAPLSWLASRLGLCRDCSQLFIQMINTDPLLRLNCLGHFAACEWERTRERSDFKKWSGLDSPWVWGRLFLFSHLKCAFNISSGIRQAESKRKRFAFGLLFFNFFFYVTRRHFWESGWHKRKGCEAAQRGKSEALFILAVCYFSIKMNGCGAWLILQPRHRFDPSQQVPATRGDAWMRLSDKLRSSNPWPSCCRLFLSV